MKKDKIIEILLIVLLFVFMIGIILFTPTINKYENVGKLIINEVMSNNKNTVQDKNGNYSDYIELYNGYDYDIDLTGYYLSDDNYETKKWQFKDITIKANSYLVVYASGLNQVIDDEIHTNFKLDKNGEIVTLSDPKAKAISKIYFEDTFSDIAYGYNGKEYVYYYVGTPNKENSGEYVDKLISGSKNQNDIKITKYMLNTQKQIKSKDGNFYGIIELYNNEDYDINLSGYHLTDDLTNKTKYTFKDVVIKSKSNLIIYTSNKNTYENEEIHTNFTLNSDDHNLLLTDNFKNEIDGVTINNDNLIKDIRINEVSSIGTEAVELKNITDKDINLKEYSIGDKSGVIAKLPNITLKANSHIVLYGSETYSYSNGKVYLGFHINNSTEEIYLYKNDLLIDSFYVGRMANGVSSGINDNNEKVYYKNLTLGKENSKTYYKGYAEEPKFSINGGYVSKETKVELSTSGNETIYYTLDGSFPNKNSKIYKEPIIINSTTVVKAISYKEDSIESEIISRTFIVGRTHDVAVVSISTNDSNLFGNSGILTYYKQTTTRKISFEFYESDGSLGVSFIGDTKLSGMDSREQPQKSMAIYLRKEYGLQEVTYPFFEDNDTTTYSSILLRNAGEDPKRIRIMDAVLTRTLKGQMDVDMQDYRPVVVYINGKYYGLYNLRDKLNGDYIESKYGIDKDDIDLIKYHTPTKGDANDYNNLINYVMYNDPANKNVYEYLKTQIDMEALCNYWIVQSYYGNTDLGNIRYWKENNTGKWRYMIYDLDWSMWNYNLNVSFPVRDVHIPAATYSAPSIVLARRLYRNSEFRDLYLKTFAYHLKNTFTPSRMNAIVDELANEIKNEMPYHINRWGYPNSISTWNNNLTNFKSMINARYYAVLNRLQSDFALSNYEYQHYFGGIK